MTYTEQAIQEAIEGGWHPTYRTLPHLSKFRTDKEVLLDPLFWQALGKSLGWEGKARECFAKGMATFEWEYQGAVGYYAWEYQWHRFIDHLSEEKSPESFFQSLLGK